MEAFMFQILVILLLVLGGIVGTVTYRISVKGLGDLPEWSDFNCGYKPRRIYRKKCTKKRAGYQLGECLKAHMIDFCQELQNGGFYRVLMDMAAAMMLSIALVYYVSQKKEGGLELYMSVFLPLLFLFALFFLYAEGIRADRRITTAVMLLVQIGIGIQALAQFKTGNINALALMENFLVGIVIGLMGVIFFQSIQKFLSRRSMLIMLSVSIVVLYLLLIAFGKAPNANSNARAWIIVAGKSFQLTEIIKVITVYLVGQILSGPESVPKRLLWSLGIMGVNGVGSAVISELGTLIVMSVVYLTLLFIYIADWKKLLLALLAFALVGCMVLGFAGMCYRSLHSNVPVDSGVTDVIMEEDNEEAETEKDVENPLPLSTKIVSKGSALFTKVYGRWLLLTDLDKAEEMGFATYQTRQARRALLMSNWLGGDYERGIVVPDSDLVMVFLTSHMGVICAILVLFLFINLLLNATRISCRNENIYDATAGISFAYALFYQALISSASAWGMFLLVGISVPVIGNGDAAYASAFIMIMTLLYVTSAAPQPEPVTPERKRKTFVEVKR